MEDQEKTRLSRVLYETYCESASWKNYQGLPCPQWDDLTDAVRRHWGAVAQKVAELPDGPPDLG